MLNIFGRKKVLILGGLGIIVIVVIILLVIFLKKDDLHLDSNNIIINTSSGRVSGKNHGYYYSFESIPYAEPPIGENRFEPPIPYKSKNDIINGSKTAPNCMQWTHNSPENYLEGQEDCLYLNVYTPLIEEGNTKVLYPIIVFIHGGAFMFGSGSMPIRPSILMNYKNIIMVQMNYRLGPLGFLSTEDDQISGNMGLKDQQLALKWIKKNAESFNGDPSQILLTGFSAGGASVHFHLLSQVTKQFSLMNSAISFSGTAHCPWVIVPKPLERAKRLANILVCPTNTTENLKNCLKKAAAEEIVKAVENFFPFLYYPFRVFGPVIESNLSKDAFITEHPTEIIKSGNFFQIPYLVAVTRNEGGYNAADLMIKKNDSSLYLEEFFKRFDELAPVALFYGETMTDHEKYSYTKYLKDTYGLFNFDSLENRYLRLQEIFSLNLFINDAKKTVELHRDYSKSAVYKYMYDNPAPYGVGNKLSHRYDFNFGTVHGDDVNLMFGGKTRNFAKFRPDEEIISNNLVNMLRNFAITGKLVFGDIDVPQNIKNLNKIVSIKITQNVTFIELENN